MTIPVLNIWHHVTPWESSCTCDMMLWFGFSSFLYGKFLSAFILFSQRKPEFEEDKQSYFSVAALKFESSILYIRCTSGTIRTRRAHQACAPINHPHTVLFPPDISGRQPIYSAVLYRQYKALHVPMVFAAPISFRWNRYWAGLAGKGHIHPPRRGCRR